MSNSGDRLICHLEEKLIVGSTWAMDLLNAVLHARQGTTPGNRYCRRLMRGGGVCQTRIWDFHHSQVQKTCDTCQGTRQSFLVRSAIPQVADTVIALLPLAANQARLEAVPVRQPVLVPISHPLAVILHNLHNLGIIIGNGPQL